MHVLILQHDHVFHYLAPCNRLLSEATKPLPTGVSDGMRKVRPAGNIHG